MSSDDGTLSEDRQIEIAMLVIDALTEDRAVDRYAGALVDLNGYNEALKRRNVNMSAIVRRTADISTALRNILDGAVMTANIESSRMSVTVEWLISFLDALLDPIGKIRPGDLSRNLRIDPEPFDAGIDDVSSW